MSMVVGFQNPLRRESGPWLENTLGGHGEILGTGTGNKMKVVTILIHVILSLYPSHPTVRWTGSVLCRS